MMTQTQKNDPSSERFQELLTSVDEIGLDKNRSFLGGIVLATVERKFSHYQQQRTQIQIVSVAKYINHLPSLC